MRKLALLVLAAVALSACNNGGGIPGIGGGVAPPSRKAGLWQQTQQRQDGTPVVTSLCLDAATDQRLPVLGRQFRRGTCTRYTITRGADGSYIADSECQADDGGVTVTNHTVASGDFQASYTVVSDITREGCVDPARDGEFKSTVTAVYKGPCPATMKPGQILRPDGTIIDIGAGRRPAGGGPGGGRFTAGGCSGPGGPGGGPGGNVAPAGNAAAPANSVG